DSGVEAGRAAVCGGLAGLVGLAATGGLAGAGAPAGAFRGCIKVGWPATLPCASATPEAAAKTSPAIAIVRILPPPARAALLKRRHSHQWSFRICRFRDSIGSKSFQHRSAV